jgi:hypothetical protein
VRKGVGVLVQVSLLFEGVKGSLSLIKKTECQYSVTGVFYT